MGDRPVMVQMVDRPFEETPPPASTAIRVTATSDGQPAAAARRTPLEAFMGDVGIDSEHNTDDRDHDEEKDQHADESLDGWCHANSPPPSNSRVLVLIIALAYQYATASLGMVAPTGGPTGRTHNGVDLESPSGVANRSEKRRAWGTISRHEIVEATLRAIKTSGFESLTIRSLSADLGVAPMSLYRHVRDKDDLLEEVADRLLADVRLPRPRRGDWRNWVIEAADRLRALLVEEPAVLYVYLHHPVVSPAAVARMERFLAVLRQAGFDDTEARHAYAAIQTYTIGFAALQASRIGWKPPPDPPDPVVLELASYATARQFGDGLRYMLEGIAGHRSSAHQAR